MRKRSSLEAPPAAEAPLASEAEKNRPAELVLVHCRGGVGFTHIDSGLRFDEPEKELPPELARQLVEGSPEEFGYGPKPRD